MAVSESQYIAKRILSTENQRSLRHQIERVLNVSLKSSEHEILTDALTHVLKHVPKRLPHVTMNSHIDFINTKALVLMRKYFMDIQKRTNESPVRPKEQPLAPTSSLAPPTPLSSFRESVPVNQDVRPGTESLPSPPQIDLQRITEERQTLMKELQVQLPAPQESNVGHVTVPDDVQWKTEISKQVEDYKAPALQHHYILVDSNHRDLREFPSSSHYRYPLSTSLKEVVEIELVQASIPTSVHVVTQENNRFAFVEEQDSLVSTAPVKEVSIEPGTYTVNQLLTALQQAIQSLSSFTYSVTRHSITGKVTIGLSVPTSSSVFRILGDRPHSILPLFGFEKMIYRDQTSYESPRSMNLFPHSYIMLHLENIPSKLIGHHGNGYIPIFFSSSMGSWDRKLFSSSSDVSHILHFTPPLDSLSFLMIHWKTWNNEEVYFSDQSHQLLFRVATWTGSVQSSSRVHHLEVQMT